MKIVDVTLEDGEGKSVTFKIAPTPLSKLAPHIATFEKGFDGQVAVTALTECIFHSAKRAKSAVTLDWLQENVDIHNMKDLTAAFVEVNGFVMTKKAGASGEAAAAGAP